MNSLADADATSEDDRVWPQHQAAITLLQSRLSVPGVATVEWLDLGSGRGQLLRSTRHALSEGSRSKVNYTGVDVNHEFLRETERVADDLGLGSLRTYVSDLGDFDKVVDSEVQFDFATFTNTAHELPPAAFPQLVHSVLTRLGDLGALFIYDLERLSPPELGAVTWEQREAERIVQRLLAGLGCDDYRPEANKWMHRSTSAWSIHIERAHIPVASDDMLKRRADALASVNEDLRTMLQERLERCGEALESLAKYGAQTAQEQTDKIALLYEFWSITRAMRGFS